jgi:transposase InsO family protein
LLADYHNRPQFIAKDLKELIRILGMTHVRVSPGYPQSNGKIERLHQSLKRECIRPKTPLSLDDARRGVHQFVEYYNRVRLHSAIGYAAPMDRMEGRDKEILWQRDRRLEDARAERKARRRKAREQQEKEAMSA